MLTSKLVTTQFCTTESKRPTYPETSHDSLTISIKSEGERVQAAYILAPVVSWLFKIIRSSPAKRQKARPSRTTAAPAAATLNSILHNRVDYVRLLAGIASGYRAARARYPCVYASQT